MSVPKKIWIGAVSGAVGIHLGAAILMLSDPPQPGAQNFGVQGIEIGLGPAGGLAGEQVEMVENLTEPEAVEEVEQAEEQDVVEEQPVEEVPEPIEPIEEVVPEPEPELEPIEPPDILPEPEPEPVEEVVEPEVAEIIAELAAVEEIAEEEPMPDPPAPEIVEEIPQIVKKVTAVPRRKPRPPRPTPPEPPKPPLPKPEPTPVPAIPEPAPTPAPAPAPKPTPQASLQGNQGITGEGNTQNIGTGTEASAGGAPGVMSDYTAYLQAWLERHKEYPRRARLRRQQGTAILHFEVNRNGTVLSYEIRESSGYRLLDDEVAKMIKRAQPLPKFPVEMARATLKILVPINFAIH